MMEVKLKDGFFIGVQDGIEDDWELTEILCEMDGGDLRHMPTAFEMVFGADGKKKLTEHFRDTVGRVRTSDMMDALKTAFEGVAALKK